MTLKVVLLGNAGTGKTCIVRQITTGTFCDSTSPTLGASYASKAVTVGGTEYKLQIWDTAGQEKFRSMAPMYYRSAHAALVVYSVVDGASFAAVDNWVTSLRDNTDPELVVFLVGNKIDLPEHAVTESDRDARAHKIGAIPWGVSAKTGEGLVDLFSELPEAVMRKRRKSPNEATNLSIGRADDGGSGKCC